MQKPQSIKTWAEQDRPREKLSSKGASSLTDAELLAILIGNGTAEMSAFDIAKAILNKANNNINALGKFSQKDFSKFKGMGPAKSITLLAALELGRRRSNANIPEKTIFTASVDAYNLMKPYMLDLKHEEFWIILLNRRNQLQKPICVSKGGLTATVADPKLILKHAIENDSSSIILVHNHPSGNLDPSVADENLTEKIKNAGQFLDITVLDHIIFTDAGYFSFSDERML